MPIVSQTYLETLFSSSDKAVLVGFINRYISKDITFQAVRDVLAHLAITESKFLPNKEGLIANALGNAFFIFSDNFAMGLHPSFDVRKNQEEELKQLFVDLHAFSTISDENEMPHFVELQKVFKRHNSLFERIFTVPKDSKEYYTEGSNDDYLNLLRPRENNSISSSNQ